MCQVITGTPANLVVLSTLEADYGSGYENIIYNIHDIYNIYNIYNVPRSGHPLSYASWMGWAVPLMVVNTSLAWLLLCTLLRLVRNTLACFQTIIQTAINNQSIHRVSGDSKTGGDTGQAERVRGVILARRRALGPPSLQESAVLGLFLLLIALLFFQSPKFMPGWADADIFTGETHRSRHTRAPPVTTILSTLAGSPRPPWGWTAPLLRCWWWCWCSCCRAGWRRAAPPPPSSTGPLWSRSCPGASYCC